MKAVRLEFGLLSRETAWWTIAGVYAVLLLYGCAQSVDRASAQQKQVTAASSDYRERWERLRRSANAPKGTWSDTRSASLVGGPNGFAVMWLPVDGTAALSPGESLRRSRVRQVSIYKAEPEPPLENPLIPAAGPFDLSFVVLWLLPLGILTATHTAVSASRENGTWPLVVLNATNPIRVALLRVALPSALLWGMSAITGLGAVAASGGTTADGWGRTAVWAVSLAMYAGVWATASVWANARAASPAAAIRVLGTAWLAAVWIVPALIDVTACAIVPPVNRLETHLAARELERDLDEKLPALTERVYAQHPDWRPTPEAVAAATKPIPGGPASRDARRVYAPALASVEGTRPFEERSAQRTMAVESLTSRLAVLSPVVAFQSLADGLAGTSITHFARFEQEVVTATEAWHGFFAPRIFLLRDLTAEDLASVPTPPGGQLKFSLRDVLWPVGILTVWCAALLAIVGRGLPAFRR